ncbi:MAG: SpoIIE family protein phosphatase [Bernardetiaceae bacterium]|jgi:serine phosphatase RsbU (regulator of sigma subunit)|nr:SpoIIE family protein phosphatase [Bernardetiaceae bacterium]
MEIPLPPAAPALAERLEQEIEKVSARYHQIGAWVAVVFDPLFGLTDYLNLPEAWLHVFPLRLGVAAVTLVAIFFFRRLKFSSATLVSIPFLLISLQNAYTFGLINQAHFLGHSLNYMALFIGAGMFILWRWYYTAVIVALSALVTVVFIGANPQLVLKDVLVQGGLLLAVTALFTVFLIQVRYRANVKIIQGQLALEQANQVLDAQKQVIESRNRNITDSIRYASRIQQAILPLPEKLANNLGQQDYFVYFQPKDIVSGDFYYLEEVMAPDGGRTVYVAAADCTGHGVPGALMSIIGSQLLRETILQHRILEPAQVLETLHTGVQQALKQRETRTNDGMDLALVALHQAPGHDRFTSLTFAGAKHDLIYFQDQACHELPGNRRSIGGQEHRQHADKPFLSHTLPLGGPPTMCYLFSDGYRDQMGGPQERKLGSRQFREILQQMHLLPLAEQRATLAQRITDWLGNRPQIDDILVVGLRL